MRDRLVLLFMLPFGLVVSSLFGAAHGFYASWRAFVDVWHGRVYDDPDEATLFDLADVCEGKLAQVRLLVDTLPEVAWSGVDAQRMQAGLREIRELVR